MEMMKPMWTSWTSVTMVTLVFHMLSLASAHYMGVCYGLNGNDLPAPRDVIGLYKRCGIELIRIYEPKPEILEALRGSQLIVAIGPRDEDIPSLATSQNATNWVSTYIAPYKNDVSFGWITIGNEVIPGPYANYVASAMSNIHNALLSIGLSEVKVTTVLYGNALAASYPPSAGIFTSGVSDIMTNIASILTDTGAPLMVNVYPYFAYATDPDHVSFDYATFNAFNNPVVDGNLRYDNLFDAMLDAFYAALEKINVQNVLIEVAETGWPSAGNDPYTSKDYAQIYLTNLLNHVKYYGTPRKPNRTPTSVFLFAMFNENQKSPGVEQNFGLFYPNMKPVFPLLENCLS